MKKNTARALTPLAVFFLLTSCHTAPTSDVSGVPSPSSLAQRATEEPRSASPAAPSAALLAPSPNLIVGRVLAVDTLRHFAFIDIASSAPASALAPDCELLARTDDLRITAHLRATRQLRGHTLGTLITAGAPNLGDEVIFPASP